MLIQLNIGQPQGNLGAGTTPTARGGLSGDVITSQLHGRFYEQNYWGNLYGGGLAALTPINNATFTVATLGATCTPILGVWNPTTSGKNLAILAANLGVTLTALTATGGGPYVWATSTFNSAISLGNAPFNRKTLLAAESVAKDLSGLALTGITNNLTPRLGSALGGGSALAISFVGTAVGAPSQLPGWTENLDGSLIVPPGGILALLATTTPVAHSAVASLLWEEIPV